MYLVYTYEMRKFLRRFATSDAGNIAMMTAVAMPLLVGAAGLGAETALWFHGDLELQQAADKAVYAAAIEKRAGSNDKTILSAATSLATKNGYSPGTIAVNYPPKAGAYAGKTTAIEVELTREIPRFFTKFFTNTPLIDNARAVASMQNSADACVLALSTSASRAVYVSGSGILSLNGCNVMSNSVKNDAIYVGGSGQLKADCLISVGGITISKSDSVATTCKSTITNAPPVGDPYADIPRTRVGSSQTRAARASAAADEHSGDADSGDENEK